MCGIRTADPFHAPKLFKVKLRLMRQTDHKNGTPSVAMRPGLVYIHLSIYIKG